jgi:O-antigen ligase
VTAVGRPRVVEWHTLVALFLVVVLFVPIRRYEVPFGLPFQLELYRAVIVVLLLAWCASLLVDQRVRLRRSGLDMPIAAVAVTAVLSVVFNIDGIDGIVGSQVAKSLLFLATFLLVFYFLVSVIRSLHAVEVMGAVLVVGGVVLAAFAALESRFGLTPFDDLHRFLPFLELLQDFEITRGANVRAMASAEHPIALGALFVMILPFAIYFAMKYRRWYQWLAVVILALGATVSVSRTAVVMLATMAFVYFVIRPRETLRLSPLLVPFVVAVHFVTPGTLGSLQASFTEDRLSNKGRTSDYDPAWQQISAKPLLGQGYGTRIPVGPDKNADVLDNQWLGSAIETGALGVFSLAWLLGGYIKRIGAAARRRDGPESWLLAGLTAATASWFVGMFLFDAFSFIQATLALFILLAMGSALVLATDPILAPLPRALVPVAPERAAADVGTRRQRHRRASGRVQPQP